MATTFSQPNRRLRRGRNREARGDALLCQALRDLFAQNIETTEQAQAAADFQQQCSLGNTHARGKIVRPNRQG